ncbi:MAG: hypothetical protein JXQ67_00510 [Campylobacterales bacterium]|nr:hypothetical protein [Campylobacterales bacterium]
MNQVNPLHIGALLVVVLLYLFFTLHTLKEELIEEKAAYVESEQLAVELSSLKDVYGDKKRLENSLKRLVAQGSLKSANIALTKGKNSWSLSAKTVDLKALNAFMSKIMNGSYNVVQLRIKKLSDDAASLEMEIAW